MATGIRKKGTGKSPEQRELLRIIDCLSQDGNMRIKIMLKLLYKPSSSIQMSLFNLYLYPPLKFHNCKDLLHVV